MTRQTVPHQAPVALGFPSKNTGVGYRFLLQVISPTQGSNSCLLHDRQILYRWATREARLHVLVSKTQTKAALILLLEKSQPMISIGVPEDQILCSVFISSVCWNYFSLTENLSTSSPKSSFWIKVMGKSSVLIDEKCIGILWLLCELQLIPNISVRNGNTFIKVMMCFSENRQGETEWSPNVTQQVSMSKSGSLFRGPAFSSWFPCCVLILLFHLC